MVTGIRVWSLDQPNLPSDMEGHMFTVTFYDDYGREIQTRAENHLGSLDLTFSAYDFEGKLTNTFRYTGIDNGADQTTITKTLRYDLWGRPTSTVQSVKHNNTALKPVATSLYRYDELGQMIEKDLGGKLQSIDYTYNIRGWLQGINQIEETGTSNVHDPVPPAPVDDLAVEVGYSSYYRLKVQMTAPGDDGNSGSVQHYAIYASSSALTQADIQSGNYEAETSWDEAIGGVAGMQTYYDQLSEDILWSMLNSGATNMYLAVVAYDDAGNQSAISNVVKFSIAQKNTVGEQAVTTASAPAWQTPVVSSVSESNADLFRMALYYDQVPSMGLNQTKATSQYNGNISTWRWQVADGTSEAKGYQYEYDRLNRLVKADYAPYETNSGEWRSSITHYDVLGAGANGTILYDLNGNIESLYRYGSLGNGNFGLIDQLQYDYVSAGQTFSSNRLLVVEDQVSNNTLLDDKFEFKDETWAGGTSVEYEYDANGNMTKDLNKRVAVEYNHLNKPTKVTKLDGSGNPTTQLIRYYYDATGTKLRQSVTFDYFNGETTQTVTDHTDYIAGFHFTKRDNQSRSLDFFTFEEGRVMHNTTTGELHYQYDLKDHLGNSRASFREDPSSQALQLTQTDSYYPFRYADGGTIFAACGRRKPLLV
ncbi:MAG: hypothetical protein R3B47_12060 [Bacteroidia bacterium]